MTQAQTTELRLAIVMNGGVSLAVWMGGVAAEIDLLRRACDGTGPPAEGALAEAWRRLASTYGVRVLVDVLAGTSAGGLNSTLLATAIARGAALPDLRTLWSESGSLTRGALVPPVDDGGPIPSLLDGKFFARTAAGAIGAIDGDPQRGGDVSLFVTATAIHAGDLRYTDGFDQGFTAPDHRRLYLFRRAQRAVYRRSRPGGSWSFETESQDDFCRDTPGAVALGQAARASAGFPVAFAPVLEEPSLLARRSVPPGVADDSPATWLMDGGVLDNAPFGPLLDEVARRPVDGPWRRVVCYVVPSSGDVDPTSATPTPADGPTWTRVVGAALGLPREADFRADLGQLTALLADAGGAGADVQALFAQLVEKTQPGKQAGADSAAALPQAARLLFPRYREAKAVAGVGELRLIAAASEKGGRLQAVPPPQGGPILAQRPSWVPESFDDPVQPWSWDIAVAERSTRLLLRRLRKRSAWQPSCTAAIADLSDDLGRVVALRDAFEQEMGRRLTVLTGATGDLSGLDDAALAAKRTAVLTDLHVPERLGELMQSTFDAFARATQLSADAVRTACLAIEVVSGALAGPQLITRAPEFRFLRLGPDVEGPITPGLREVGGSKLYGTGAGHFGAFGLPEWRSWDWMWGRLDAVAHLCRLVMTDADEASIQQQIGVLQDLVLAEEPASAPPGVEEPTTAERRAWVAREVLRIRAEPPDLLAELTRDRATLVETALRFAAGSDAPTVPSPVRRLARWLNLLLAQQPAVRSPNWKERTGRGLARPARAYVWSKLGDPAPDPDQSAGARP